MELDENMIKTLRPMFDSIAEAQATALALLGRAVARQLDAALLAEHLRLETIEASERGLASELTKKLVVEAIAAISAVAVMQEHRAAKGQDEVH